MRGPGYFGDGGGLWLQVSSAGTKSWVFRFALAGRAREMGLGPLHTVTLAEAREKALECRKLLINGIDPIEARKLRRTETAAAAAKVITFNEAAEAYVEAHRAGWKNAKHAQQFENTLNTYAAPCFGALPVSAVDTGLVMKVLEPIWTTKTETATRVRGRIEAVLDWCTVRGYRAGDNPARWRGHLDHLLPSPSKVAKVENHAALPYARIGAFMAALRAQDGTAARAVELIVLTAARTSEVLLAEWGEFDLAGSVWTCPADHMKSGRPHRVPLSTQAVRLLKAQLREQGSPYVFPGAKEGKPLSNMSGLQLLKRMGYGEYTVHGMRSTFRDWAAEQTNFPREVAEAALAHTLKDKTEAAYQRGDVLQKRAKLMQAWADFCDRIQRDAEVIEMQNRAAR